MRTPLTISDHQDDADGFTLLELLVAMGIFTVVLLISITGIVSLTQQLRKTSNISDSTDQARRAFTMLDKQVRYASSLNPPGASGSNFYVEFLTTVGGTSRCDQWRVDSVADTLQTRHWTPTAPAQVTPWLTIARGVTNDLVNSPPFSVAMASATQTRQILNVDLRVQNGNLAAANLRTQLSLVARNTSTASVTNGASTPQVCTEVGRP